MAYSLWISFVLASLLIIATPGPVVTLLITTSIDRGKNAAFLMLPGIFLGDFAAMIMSFAGVGALLLTSPTFYTIMKLVGAAYLVYIGTLMWTRSYNFVPTRKKFTTKNSQSAIKAFCVTVLNPKSLLFFAAFMPQFVSKNDKFLPQLIILGITYLGIGLLNDITYTLLANKVARFLNDRFQKLINRIAAINLILTGIIILGLQHS